MNYVTATTYQSWDRIGAPYEKNGKMYQTVQTKCDRCTNGVYVCRVENGQPVPHPAYGGVCLKCGGSGFERKDVRLYTEEEFTKMQNRAAATKLKKAAEAEARMKAEYADKRKKWLEDNNFSEDGFTYVITGDSYSIKDELKDAGFKFDYVLLWHKADPAGYEDRTLKISLDEVVEINAFGVGHYKEGAKDYVESLLRSTSPESASEWIGEVGSVITREVKLILRKNFETRFGLSTVYRFEDAEGNILVWFSSVEIHKEAGDQFKIKGRVKSHDEYKGIKQTILTRCTIL